MRPAALTDRDLLVELMEEFYRESRYPLNRERAGAAFAELLADDRLGRVWLLEAEGRGVGYVVLTLGYSMEYGGRDAFVDDLFIREPYRGRGLGEEAMAAVLSACRELGVRALHLEVGEGNAPAQRLYRRTGFRETGRQLLTLRLGDPVHED